MLVLRIYLLAGLIAHKALWEVMKRRHPEETGAGPPLSPRARLAKLVKLAILIGIVVQTLAPDILPILQDPGILRIGGALIFTLGLSIAMVARVQLGDSWSDIELGRVPDGHGVQTRGLYRIIKHPIYVGDLLLLAGLELSLNSWLVLAVALTTPLVLFQALREERVLVEQLPGYAEYAARTKRFIPFVV